MEGWVDHFDTWVSDLAKRLAAQPDPEQPTQQVEPQDIPLQLEIGARLIDEAAGRAKGSGRRAAEGGCGGVAQAGGYGGAAAI